MKKCIFLVIFLVFFLLSGMQVKAQYVPLELSGFTIDGIVDSGEAMADNQGLDKNGWIYYSQSYKAQGGLSQSVTSVAGVNYTFASFKENNTLQLSNLSQISGTLTLAIPVEATELWILGMSVDGGKNVSFIVNYEDGSKSPAVSLNYADWLVSSGAALSGLSRIKKSDSSFDTRFSFGLYERTITTDPAKKVKSVTASIESAFGTNIFAISALPKGAVRPKVGDAYVIFNSHLDTQWNWTVQTTIDSYIPKTLDQNFALFDKYPNYKLNFEGAIRYMFMKEYYPDKYNKLKNYIGQGRWIPAGGAIDASDVMAPSAESIIRNFLYGQSFFMNEFGVRGGRDIFLPDCFGFPYSLPTLGKHCGRDIFHTAKLAWGSAAYDNLGNYQNWQGVDGSKIMAVIKPQPYNEYTPYQSDMSYSSTFINEANINKQTLGVPSVFRYVGPSGDQGGAVPDANGQWLEKSLTGGGPVNVQAASPTQFYESFTQAQIDALPVWNSELPLKTHGVGCYTSKAILKYWNRKNELLADATEKSSYLAHRLGGLNYQSDVIRDSWVRILWHQFHDDLPGTSTPQAYTYTQNDHVLAQLDLSKTLINAVGAISQNLSTQVAGTPMIVYNPLSILREDIVEAAVNLESAPASISVYNKDNEAVPAQIISYKDGKLSFIFLAAVPSLGYEVYELRLNDNASNTIPSTLSISGNTIENSEYKISVDDKGDVSSIIDKTQGNKELLSAPVRLLMLLNNTTSSYPSWEIAYETLTAAPTEYVDENVAVSIAEQGPLRSALKITRQKAGSEFVQYIRLSAAGSSARIDFVNEVDWRTKERLLKVNFPLTASNPSATFDISIGAIERGNRNVNMYELSGHQWADLTNNDNSYGVSILNDCKYGWDKPNNNSLRLTLIHTPKGNDRFPYQAVQDFGLNRFIYSFYRHQGKWNETTQWEAAKLNQPMLAFESPKHTGDLGKSLEFVKLNTDKVAVKALKKAENSDDMIIRLYELTGENQDDVQMTFPATIVAAKEVNGVEEDVADSTVDFSGNTISLSMTKYQPRTLLVKLASINVTAQENPVSIPVDLTYNIDVMSADSKMDDGRFGATNLAYPAELLSDEITADGIRFKIGGRTDGQLNAVRCNGQTINLPASSEKRPAKLYLLAASQNDAGTAAEFKIDNVSHTIHIEYFADFLGLYGSPFSDGFYKKENVAFTATHRHDVVQKKNVAYSYLYMFKYVVPVPENVQTLTLPNDPNVIVFAVTLSDNHNDDIHPLSDVVDLPTYGDIQSAEDPVPCGGYLKPATVTASGYVNESEAPAMAADRNSYTKWCDKTANQWLEYDFGKEIQICQWNVTHAGIEKDEYITSDFALQRYDAQSGAFVDVDKVTNNTSYKTCRQIAPFAAQKVRLKIDKADRNNTGTARIYSFDIFGKAENSTALPEINQPASRLLGNYPNPFSESTTISYLAPDKEAIIRLNVYNITGMQIDSCDFYAAGGTKEIVWNNPGVPSGIYFYTVSAIKDDETVISTAAGKMIIAK